MLGSQVRKNSIHHGLIVKTNGNMLLKENEARDAIWDDYIFSEIANYLEELPQKYVIKIEVNTLICHEIDSMNKDHSRPFANVNKQLIIVCV